MKNSITLTDSNPRLMLALLSQKTKDGIETPRKGEKSPLPLVVFFRPLFLICMELIRAFVIMVGCFREALKSFARSFAGSLNLIQSTATLLRPTGGGLSSHKGVSVMSHEQTAPSTQSPIVLNPQTLAKVMQWLERAENHAANLVLKFSGHESALELTEIEFEIATAYNLLSHVIMSGVKKGGV